MKNFYIAGIVLLITMSCHCHADLPYYRSAIVRGLADTFEDSLKLDPPVNPINFDLAELQHETYMRFLEKLIPNVVKLDADPNHPDCNFIEDTAIIVGDVAVISRMGAVERRGEEIPVAGALCKLGMKKIFQLNEPSTMDGGDILYTGKHLFVGLSRRTNEHALNELKEIFSGKVEVVAIPVNAGLHLKSLISFFDSETLIIAANQAGKEIQDTIESITDGYSFIPVPDSIASNVLRIGSHLFAQDGFPSSEKILQSLCDEKKVKLITLEMSELIKADGALTCGSLLLE